MDIGLSRSDFVETKCRDMSTQSISSGFRQLSNKRTVDSSCVVADGASVFSVAHESKSSIYASRRATSEEDRANALRCLRVSAVCSTASP